MKYATITAPAIEWTRINNDANGHFLTFITDKDQFTSPDQRYALAISRAKKLGGKKYHNRNYGGGIVFQSYNNRDLELKIAELLAVL